MQRDEAKAILELCRPGNADDRQDPLIAEALGLLETDVELKAWFEEQQALDARIGESLNGIEAPAALKASILAGMRAHALGSEGESESDHVPTASPAWWRNPWIGLAAVFALLFVILAVPREGGPTQVASSDSQALQAGVPAMVQFLANEIDSIKSQKRSFAKQSEQPETLQAYLASSGAPSPATLPAPLRTKPSIGCFTLDYKGIEMGMICFKEDKVIHLITVRKTDCIGQIADGPGVYETNGQAFKIWIEGEQVYILSVEGCKETLPEFI